MPTSPEIEPQVTEIPSVPEISPEVERSTGIKVIQKTFKAQVRDDKGAPLIQTPPAQVITITPPASQTVLASWAKGSVSSSLTWLAAFWLRVIKKALHFGWKIVGKELQQ